MEQCTYFEIANASVRITAEISFACHKRARLGCSRTTIGIPFPKYCITFSALAFHKIEVVNLVQKFPSATLECLSECISIQNRWQLGLFWMWLPIRAYKTLTF